MSVMAEPNPFQLDFDGRVEEFVRHRRVHPEVLRQLLNIGLLGPETWALDVGCGTGNDAAALSEATGCRMSGIDPSAQMLDYARSVAPWESLTQGIAELLPFADASFDLVMSTDVIHHVRDRDAYFHEAARVLRRGGHIVTVTDSHDDIPLRQPLSSHFPETVSIELRRYPPVPKLLAEMSRAGFVESHVVEATHAYELIDIRAYRERAFSSLLLIDDDAFGRGVARLEADLAREPIPCVSRYTLIWGTLPDV